VGRKEAKGLDATFAYDWSPPGINRDYTMLMAGLRFKDPLPLSIHNTLSLGYVENSQSSHFLPSLKTERGMEINGLLNVLSMVVLRPVLQCYSDMAGRAQRAVASGFRRKSSFKGIDQCRIFSR